MSDYTWPDILTGLVRSEGLEEGAATWALNEIFASRASDVQIAALLTALRAKGETEDEIRGMAEAMLSNALPITLDPDAVDIVGTGGDRANTVNISTMAAVVMPGPAPPSSSTGTGPRPVNAVLPTCWRGSAWPSR